jgi:pimeloyl-ACP methyl ester carboxylesterase
MLRLNLRFGRVLKPALITIVVAAAGLTAFLFFRHWEASQASFRADAEGNRSIASYFANQPKPPFRVLSFSNGQGYEFRNEDSDKLLILLAGSGFSSVMAPRMVGDVADFYMSFLDAYTIFVPEKFDWALGSLNNHVRLSAREQYTVHARIDNLYEVITEYLAQNNFQTIVIIGGSEGAVILPELHNRLNNPNIKALVSSAGGGLTYYEGRRITFEKLSLGGEISAGLSGQRILEWKQRLEEFFEFSEGPFNDSPELMSERSETTYRWLASIMHYDIFSQLKTINTPMLFTHGELDLNVPVESTRFVEDNLPNAPFTFIYYDDESHTVETVSQMRRANHDIREWLAKILPP